MSRLNEKEKYLNVTSCSQFPLEGEYICEKRWGKIRKNGQIKNDIQILIWKWAQIELIMQMWHSATVQHSTAQHSAAHTFIQIYKQTHIASMIYE